MKYTLYIDDNYHYMDERERCKRGEFATWEAAESRARQIVDQFLKESYKKGMTAEELYGHFISFGEDPFIVGGDADQNFSARDYAKNRSHEIAGFIPLRPVN